MFFTVPVDTSAVKRYRMDMTEFRKFPSIGRLRRECVITEKIDGTNACVVVEEYTGQENDGRAVYVSEPAEGAPDVLVYAQSRSRLITPEEDNHGFARWVHENADGLAQVLGTGYHYGEWWGSGVNRGYGLVKGEKRFSLFNATRYMHLAAEPAKEQVPSMYTVPVLSSGNYFNDRTVDMAIELLRMNGSYAAPGYRNPEGIVIWHKAANALFKWTFDGDGHKGVQ